MLAFLRIRNFALVEDVEIGFGPGFNVVTGETGAGKSLLLGALNLLLGERAGKAVVRAGAADALIEAGFNVAGNAAVAAVLDESGLDACEDGILLLRRFVAREGAGRNFVNGGATPLAVFKRLGDLLVDLHGPHEHQSLFAEGPRIAMLDAFGAAAAARDAYARAYREMQSLRAQREKAAGIDGNDSERMELLDFQARELEEAGLDAAEEAALDAEMKTVANAWRIRELGAALAEAMTGDEASAFRAVTDGQRMLTELERIFPAAADWNAEARELAARIRALSDAIEAAAGGIEGDAGRLAWLENRMALYFRLKRKYNASVPELRDRLAQWRGQLEEWRGRDGLLREIDARAAIVRKRLDALGKDLRALRAAAAAAMAAAVTRQLADLGLAAGEFKVEIEPAAEPRPDGLDRVEYTFTPNVGEPSAALRGIASSGEISRVMLAVKAVLAEHDRIPVLLFDEIDANLGGESGHAVGRKLAELARSRQVICITHLAQVAACGGVHFAVSKEVSDGRTRTVVERLAGSAQRSRELVRMLGGRAAGPAALRHAEAMLRQAARAQPPVA